MPSVQCKHCFGPVSIRDDEYTVDDPYVYACPHCGKGSEEELDEPLLSFQVRSKMESDKYQVRFWSDPKLYKEFTKACKKEDLKMQDVFNDFIEWFIEASKKKTLKIKEN